MRVITVGELKRNFRSIFRDVGSGEQMILLDGDKPIAQILPIAAADAGGKPAQQNTSGWAGTTSPEKKG